MPSEHTETFPVKIDDLAITAQTLWQAAGYAAEPDFLSAELAAVLADMRQYDDLCAGYRILTDHKLTVTEQGFYLDECLFATGPEIAACLQDSTHLAVFAATAGVKICGKIAAAGAAGNQLQVYLYDLLGSEMAEALAAWVHAAIEVKAKASGLRITNRYSPGYCGWDVAEQQKLFALLPADFCGISLTPSSLMIPMKSVSGIIGTGAHASRKAYGCALCTQQNCYKRK